MKISLDRRGIFYSIQGEGASAGIPAVFIRTAGCNLKCAFCDVPETWDWQRFDARQEVVQYTPAQVVETVMERFSKDFPLLVVTGGEPMLQQAGLAEFMRLLKSPPICWPGEIEVETNGTILPEQEFDSFVTRFNVSPKLSNNVADSAAKRLPSSLKWFARSAKATFKFVVAAPRDIDEIFEMISRFGIDKKKVILMPEGIDEETLQERGRWLAEECKRRGVRLGGRLHINLWGNMRGT
jgi:organic radical activating enzyme